MDLAKVIGAQLGQGGGRGQDVEIDFVHQGKGGGQVDGGGPQLFHSGGRGQDVEIDVIHLGGGGGQVDGGLVMVLGRMQKVLVVCSFA